MPRSSRSKKTAIPQNSVTLALSPMHERLGNLEIEHQQLLEKIKKKRKELDNLVDNIRSIATEIHERTGSYLQKMSILDEKIHALFTEILSNSKLGKQTRKKIEKVYFNLQLGGIIHSVQTDDDEDNDFEETEEEEDPNFFSGTQEPSASSDSVIPPSSRKTEESRHIRQIFLKLAENFHPDKVTDIETQSHYTEIMKELNRAYQERDVARLLEIERQHLDQKTIDVNSEDDLTRGCQIKERENQLLKKQYEHILQELNLFKRTPEGELVKNYRKAKREKIDLIQSMIEELEEEIEIMEEIYQFVQDFRDKKITVKEFMKGPDVIARKQEQMMEEFMEEMLGGSVIIIR